MPIKYNGSCNNENQNTSYQNKYNKVIKERQEGIANPN